MPYDRDRPLIEIAEEQVKSETRLTPSDLFYLFGVMLACPKLYEDALRAVDKRLFFTFESEFLLLWNSMAEVWEAANQFSYEAVRTTCLRRLQVYPSDQKERIFRELLEEGGEGFLHFAMVQCPPTYWDPQVGRHLLGKFLQERQVLQPLQQFLLTYSNAQRYGQGLPRILRRAAYEIDNIQAVSSEPPEQPEAVPDFRTYRGKPVEYTRTGLDFIDNFIGGERNGDANAIIGPFQSGKSTLLRQMAVRKAKNCWDLAQSAGRGRPKVVLLFNYEEEMNKYMPGIWAYGASIQRSRLEGENLRHLSRDGELLEYERRRVYHCDNPLLAGIQQECGTDLPGEQSRWDFMRKWLNPTLVVVDMSGIGGKKVGHGGVREIANITERVLDKMKAECGGVFIDYAKLVAKRQAMDSGAAVDPFQFRQLLSNFGEHCLKMIAAPLNCPVWIAHQFTGSENKKSPTVALTHSEASEAKDFAENMAVVGCLGTKCRVSNCVRLDWTKVRYDFRSQDLLILQHDPDFSCLVNVSDDYEAIRSQGKFVPRDESVGIYGAEDAQPTARQRDSVAAASGFDFGGG